MVVFAEGGDDWFRNRSNLPTRIYGQGGDDTLVGGSGSDRLVGGAGADFLIGGRGDDFINGNDGKDRIRGFSGTNTIYGGSDADNIIGGDQRDVVYGEGGDDSIWGSAGNDYLSGGAGSDILGGHGGSDTLMGDEGNDRAYGGDSDDRLEGGTGNDNLIGGNGDDSIRGGDDSDYLRGGSGLDRMFGELGDDSLFGGDDDDMIVGNEGKDYLRGGSGNDAMYGFDGDDYLDGEDGHDRIFAGNGNDIMKGSGGRDQLFGQDGRDRLFGGLGNDDLVGGLQADRLEGGQGNDDFTSDDSDDVFDDSDDFNANDDFEIRGTIENLNEANRTFDILGIPVDYSVAFVQGQISEGAFVKAEGAYDGSSLLAKEVEPEQDDRQENIEAIGQVSNLNTTAQTFEFLSFTVNYSGARVDGSVSESSMIELEGRYDGNGNIAALRIESTNGQGGDDGDNGDDDNDDDNGGDNLTNGSLELRGEIANLNSSSQTFTILGVQVDYSSAQITGTMANGGFFKVDGLYDGILVAREVETETPDDDRDENVEAVGVVENLDAQAQTFTLLGFTVDFSGAEVDDAFEMGDTVEVEGWFANDLITAEEVKI